MDRTEKERRTRNAAYAKKSRAKRKQLIERVRHRFEIWHGYYRSIRLKTVDGENVAAQIVVLDGALDRLQNFKGAYEWLRQLSGTDSPLLRFLSKVPPPLPPLPPPPQHDEHVWSWLQAWKAEQDEQGRGQPDYMAAVASEVRAILMRADYLDRLDP
jgi:hypothetical protein